MKRKIKSMDRYTKLAVIVILIAVALRFYLASAYHVSGDACWHLSNSKFIAENHKLPLFEQFGRDEPFWAPPLFHIVSAFVYEIFSGFNADAANFAVKMVSPVLGSLALILSFLTARILFSKKTAFYALLFLAFIPIHLDYSVFSYVDSMVAFLAVLSVYLALKNRTALSAAAAGLAILTKYNGVFILPVLMYIIYLKRKGSSQLLKNIIILLAISLAIGSVWFIRNWIYLGNPVWPFMNNLFHGYEIKSFAESSVGAVKLSNIFSINTVTFIYLEIFGVPNGNISALSFFNIPYLNFIFAVWLMATIIFLIPFFMGICSKKLEHKSLLFAWIGSYIALILLYIINSSWSVARFMLPAFPAIAMIWAHGLQKIKSKNIRKAFIIMIALIMAGFALTSFVKISLAANSWELYNSDFEWVRSNTGKESIFLTESQCLSYNIGRQTARPEIKNLEKADYIWVNQGFKLDKRAILKEGIIKELGSKGITKVYENRETGTKVYKIAKHGSKACI